MSENLRWSPIPESVPPVRREPPGAAKRIELLQFVTDFRIGGTERQAVNLGKSLADGRFNLHLACFRRSGQFLREIMGETTPLTEYTINSLYNRNTIHQQFRFAKYLRRHGIHIVHTYGFYPNVFAIPAARLAGVPAVVASIRDMGELWTPMQRRVQKFLCRFAHRIVVNAHAIKLRLMEEGYRPERITVIRNGLDLSRFKEIRRNNGLRQALGLPPHAPLVGVVGRIHPMKGIEDFLDAARIVAGRFPDARFLVVGDGAAKCGNRVVPDSTYTQELKQLTTRLGLASRVVFTGFRLDTPDLLAELAVSVLPSLSEGLSNVLLESMAAGVPVVATRVGGNPEAVEEKITGLLVPPRDSVAMALAICELLEDPERSARLGQAGRQRVSRHFSLERMVQDTERLYQELVHQAGNQESNDLQHAPSGLVPDARAVRANIIPDAPVKQRASERPL